MQNSDELEWDDEAIGDSYYLRNSRRVAVGRVDIDCTNGAHVIAGDSFGVRNFAIPKGLTLDEAKAYVLTLYRMR